MIGDLSALLAGFGVLVATEMVLSTILAFCMIAFLCALFAVILATLAVRWFVGLFRVRGTADGSPPSGNDPSVMR